MDGSNASKSHGVAKTRTSKLTCRLCGGAGSVRTFLSLGRMPPGNAFINPEEVPNERAFHLDIGFCTRCYVVEVIRPAPASSLEKVYQHYSYIPTGATLTKHYQALANELIHIVRPSKGSLFLDIGSNDGLLLSSIHAEDPSSRVVGVEPSSRIAGIARERGVQTINRFFDSVAAREVRSKFGRPQVITMTQVLQHIRNPLALLNLVEDLVDPGGVLVLEGRAYFPDVVQEMAFDTFYHELLFSFTLHSLGWLLRQAGFAVFHAERQSSYGGSLRVYAQKKDRRREAGISVRSLLDAERAAGLDRFATYRKFGNKVDGIRAQIVGIVSDLKSLGFTIVGYGAPSTGNTLLAYCGLGPQSVDYIVDDNPLKQGLVTPGTHIPITDVAYLRRHPPDYVLLIAWRLKKDILSRLGTLGNLGIKGIIVPLPKPAVTR